MGEINILHLSDIHFKRDKHDDNPTFRLDVQNKMVAAIQDHLKDHDPPDFVAVTGDIAFSGKKSEYEQAARFFESLKSVLPAETVFLMVPGNHDVDRGRVDDMFRIHDVVMKGAADLFLKDKNKINFFVNPKFNAYYKFVNQINTDLYRSAGDYYWVKNYKDKDVSFLGLNTAWASEMDNEYQKIALGYRQLRGALEKATTPHKILLLHHPLDNWLELRDVNECKKDIFKECRLLLHGHNHQDAALVLVDPDHAFISLGANASYTTDKEGFIGFLFLQVQFQNEDSRIRVWPYIFDERRRNDFVLDRERWQKQKGKEYFDIDTLALKTAEEEIPRPTGPLQIPEEYKNWLAEFHSTMAIDQLAKKGEAITISLPEVYIRLETTNNIYIEEELGRVNCLLLQGAAGMGKTTLVKHLAYTITHGSGTVSLQNYLPVIVFLKDLWPLYEEEIKANRGGVKFDSLLPDYIEKIACPLEMEVVEDYLAQNRALFLLDGLDEVPEHLRSHLVEVFSAFRFKHKQNRFLLTGRPHGIDGKASERFGKYLQEIEPLDQEKIETFIEKWFRAVSGRARGLADLTAGGMISDIREHEHVSVFTRNPLLLTAVCILYQVGKRLPEQRADLYRRIVDNLLYRRFHDSASSERGEQIQSYLMLLAFTMQKAHVRHMEVGEAKDILKVVFQRGDGENPNAYIRRIDNLFEEIEPNCGLLNRLSSGYVGFRHSIFQEFLAVRHMIDMGIDFHPFLDQKWWEEALLLYIGLVSLERSHESNKLVREIINHHAQSNVDQVRLWLLGARALRDMQPSRRDADVVALVRRKLLELIGSESLLEEHNDDEDRNDMLSNLKKVEDLENKARSLIRDGKYQEARAFLKQIIELSPQLKVAIQNEFGFLYNFDGTLEEDQKIWTEKKEVVNLWKNLWLLTSRNNKSSLEEEEKLTINDEDKSTLTEEGKEESSLEYIVSSKDLQISSQAKGEKLEKAVLALFREFFVIGKEEGDTVLKSIRQQNKGSQFGFDISFECVMKDNKKVTCKIECKNVKNPITDEDIAHKLLAVENSDKKIDHWILFSARSDPSNTLNELIASWEKKDRFPFEIHLWSPNEGIKEFFGLKPDLYDKFYDESLESENHPRNWSESKKGEVIKKWKEKLRIKPFMRLPKVWKEYIKDPKKILLKEEVAECNELETLYENYVPLRGLDKTGVLLDGTMEDHVRQWLLSTEKDVMFILGEFGDGKSFFTYYLSRNLAKEYIDDPDNGWMPVRFSLSDYQAAKDTQNFLLRRLKQFRADLGDWNDLRSERGNILIILDGFDEMTPKLDSLSIKKNIKDLTDCYLEFKGMKILITSRTHFFESKQNERLLFQRLEYPPIYYLAPIERKERIKFLESSNTDPKRRELLRILCKLHDPLDLASKPLFLNMIEVILDKFERENLDESTLSKLNEVRIYNYYIEEVLNRKITKLYSEETVDLEDIVSNLTRILEKIAIKFQESNPKYIFLKKFSSDVGEEYDEILWKISEEDAMAKIKVRSLLIRDVKNNNQEKRSVKFCNRSMLEFFVAKGICRALNKDKKRGKELLTKLPLNHEILYFTAELMKNDEPKKYEKNLIDITRSSKRKNEEESPGGNAITLLFRLLGELPDSNWSGLNLDGADLSGADLSNMDFRDTSMRNATLNNVNLEKADFRNSDLIGVTIEETAPVLALASRYLAKRIFAAYKDKTIREWTGFAKKRNARSETIINDTKGAIICLGFIHSSALCGLTNEEMIFYDLNRNDKLIQKARFKISPKYKRLIVKENSLLMLAEVENQKNIVQGFDLEKFEEKVSFQKERVSVLESLDFKFFAFTDGRSYLCVEDVESSRTIDIKIPSINNISSLKIYSDEKGEQFLLACGQDNGEVLVWKVAYSDKELEPKLIMKSQVHDGIVSTLLFLDDTRVVSGGVDRKICISKFDEESTDKKGILEDTLHLTLRCEGMKIEGMESQREQNLFKKLIQKDIIK